MNRMKLLFALHFFMLCSLMLTSCTNEDNGSTAPTELLLNDGEWTGSGYTLTSKAVIIATGGFGANLDMVTRLQPSLSGFATLNHPGATGDAVGWVTAVGGATVQMANIQIHPTAEATNHILITEAVRKSLASIKTYARSGRHCGQRPSGRIDSEQEAEIIMR